MLRNGNLPLNRAWNTWSSRPAEMVFLPLGVRLTPLAFAASTGKATLFGAGEAVRLGRHSLDGSLVELDLTHAGTRLSWSYAKSDPFCLSGAWRLEKAGEWGLRFWINLCLSTEEGHEVRYDEATGVALLKIGQRFVALASSAPPVLVTGHACLEAALADYEEHGYFHLGSRAQSAPVLMLRFNLEMMRDNRFAVAIADREDLAIERARWLAAAPVEAPPTPMHEDGPAIALDALRDVMAWNTVWDDINQRPYTSISRNWNLAKFGGFGVWLNDQLYAALMTGDLDGDLARENLMAVLKGATPQGNLACLLTANDAWIDRSQSPLGAFIVWLLYLRRGSRDLLESAYDTLARNHAWWWRERDPHKSGLASFGTSDVGEGLYKGTSFGARNESAMDNSPVHDETKYDPSTRTLDSFDVGLNALLALDAEILALIAGELGRHNDTASFAARADATRTQIRERLWDEERGIFANRLFSGAFVRSLAPTSFFPLLAGAATKEQALRLQAHLKDPVLFGGDPVIPGIARNDPAFGDNLYWRGRIWPPFNFLVYQGLRRYGAEEQAAQLACASFALFRRVWESLRICPENYNAQTGEPLDQPDTERFYSWGALMAKLGVAAITDITPWHGWDIANDGEPTRLGQLSSPIGQACLVIDRGELTLSKGDRAVIVTNMKGRITHLSFADNAATMLLPPSAAEAFIRFPGVEAARVVEASLDGNPVHIDGGKGGSTMALPAASAPRELVLRWMVRRAPPP